MCNLKFGFSSDKIETPTLPIYGKGELTAGCPVPLPDLPANQEKTQVMLPLWELSR